MKLFKITQFILISMLFNTAQLNAQPQEILEHRVWNKTPIHIVLPVGQERRIDFPLSIQLQVPSFVKLMSERIQITESGSVYWMASKSFKKQRILAVTDTGYSYVLDVEARPKGHRHPIVIIDERIAKSNANGSIEEAQLYDYDYVDLMRFASQNLYAPERLIKKLPGIKRIDIEKRIVPLVKGGDFIAESIAQWVAPTIPSLYVSAIRISSNSLTKKILDPRLIRGDFVAASSQHSYINSVGEDGDTTMWYLVSEQPFNEVAP